MNCIHATNLTRQSTLQCFKMNETQMDLVDLKDMVPIIISHIKDIQIESLTFVPRQVTKTMLDILSDLIPLLFDWDIVDSQGFTQKERHLIAIEQVRQSLDESSEKTFTTTSFRYDIFREKFLQLNRTIESVIFSTIQGTHQDNAQHTFTTLTKVAALEKILIKYPQLTDQSQSTLNKWSDTTFSKISTALLK